MGRFHVATGGVGGEGALRPLTARAHDAGARAPEDQQKTPQKSHAHRQGGGRKIIFHQPKPEP